MAEEWSDTHEELFQEAVTKFSARCLWNMPKVRTFSGLSAIANHLMSEGNMASWALGIRIREFIREPAVTISDSEISGNSAVPSPR